MQLLGIPLTEPVCPSKEIETRCLLVKHLLVTGAMPRSQFMRLLEMWKAGLPLI